MEFDVQIVIIIQLSTILSVLTITSFGPYFKTAVQMFSRMDLTIGQ